ncbi:hypothetical protein BKA67DRAFT_656293 [Truncatella angustata]|uniref:Uncharacterized protein n=1 Tax=Truncatella angustata TaxID=152316 RepID=A0A9P8UTU7_9PEZI|nr:uncharacterized protein BKA67DRAFT_656293 [Truncatella angustata]KAH6658066.1 hypothetical protein BKA67DRAFT_656293 [Truncatella angustata]
MRQGTCRDFGPCRGFFGRRGAKLSYIVGTPLVPSRHTRLFVAGILDKPRDIGVEQAVHNGMSLLPSVMLFDALHDSRRRNANVATTDALRWSSSPSWYSLVVLHEPRTLELSYTPLFALGKAPRDCDILRGREGIGHFPSCSSMVVVKRVEVKDVLEKRSR